MTAEYAGDKSKINAWILAARPKTLPAALAPVTVGTALAIADHSFAGLPAGAAVLVALLLQIGVNLANDYFDYFKGIDTADRQGPVRVTQSGLIAPGRVKGAMTIIFCLAAAAGLYLATVGGWPVIVIGAASILAALAYSSGPWPLASHGLGDIFVFIFFGPVAVCGTYYVQSLQVTLPAVLLGVAVGLPVTAILVVNNLRDIRTDERSGKRTLAVLLGAQGARWEYTLLLAAAYSLPVILWLNGRLEVWTLLPLISLPAAFLQIRALWRNSAGPALNQQLGATARLALFYSLLLSLGIVFAAF